MFLIQVEVYYAQNDQVEVTTRYSGKSAVLLKWLLQ